MSAEEEGAWLQDRRRNDLQDSLHSLSLGAVQAFAPRIADRNGPAELSAEVAPRHCSRKILMKTIVGVHDGRNTNAGALEARDRVGSLRGILVALLSNFAFHLCLFEEPSLLCKASPLGIGEKKGG